MGTEGAGWARVRGRLDQVGNLLGGQAVGRRASEGRDEAVVWHLGVRPHSPERGQKAAGPAHAWGAPPGPRWADAAQAQSTARGARRGPASS